MTNEEEMLEVSEAIQAVVFQATEQYLMAVYPDTQTQIISDAMRIAMPKVSTAMVAALAETKHDRSFFLDDFLRRAGESVESIKQHPIPKETMQ